MPIDIGEVINTCSRKKQIRLKVEDQSIENYLFLIYLFFIYYLLRFKITLYIFLKQTNLAPISDFKIRHIGPYFIKYTRFLLNFSEFQLLSQTIFNLSSILISFFFFQLCLQLHLGLDCIIMIIMIKTEYIHQIYFYKLRFNWHRKNYILKDMSKHV